MLFLPYGGRADVRSAPHLSGRMILKRIGSSIDRNPASLIWPLQHTVTPPHWPVCLHQTAHALGVALAPEATCACLGTLHWRGEQSGERRGLIALPSLIVQAWTLVPRRRAVASVANRSSRAARDARTAGIPVRAEAQSINVTVAAALRVARDSVQGRRYPGSGCVSVSICCGDDCRCH